MSKDPLLLKFVPEAHKNILREMSFRGVGTNWLSFQKCVDSCVMDTVWVIKTGEDEYRLFDSSEEAEAYYALSGLKRSTKMQIEFASTQLELLRPTSPGVILTGNV